MTITIKPYKNITPNIDDSCFIADQTSIIGDVVIGAETSIWYGSVIRGDVNIIRIGSHTNIQDGTIIHVATHGQGTHIGDRVTIGHQALLHDCIIEDDAYIGMQACVMDGAIVKKGAFIAAGSLVTPGKVIPSGQLWGGRPAQYMRDLTDRDKDLIAWSWPHYCQLAAEHKKTGN